MHLLPNNLGPLADVCAKSDGRWANTGVHIEVKDDTFEAVATDGKILVVVEGAYVADPKDYPSIPAFEIAPNGSSKALVPRKFWKETFDKCRKLTARTIKPILRKSVAIKIGPREVTLAATDLDSSPVATSTQIEGRFPQYQNIIPKEKPVYECYVSAKLLMQVLKIASAYTADGDDDHKVKFHLYDDEGKRPFMITCSTADHKFVGLQMPCS